MKTNLTTPDHIGTRTNDAPEVSEPISPAYTRLMNVMNPPSPTLRLKRALLHKITLNVFLQGQLSLTNSSRPDRLKTLRARQKEIHREIEENQTLLNRHDPSYARRFPHSCASFIHCTDDLYHYLREGLTPHETELIRDYTFQQERLGNHHPILLNYNPDEPRDERGRWTSGGGSESQTSVFPDVPGIRPTTPEEMDEIFKSSPKVASMGMEGLASLSSNKLITSIPRTGEWKEPYHADACYNYALNQGSVSPMPGENNGMDWSKTPVNKKTIIEGMTKDKGIPIPPDGVVPPGYHKVYFVLTGESQDPNKHEDMHIYRQDRNGKWSSVMNNGDFPEVLTTDASGKEITNPSKADSNWLQDKVYWPSSHGTRPVRAQNYSIKGDYFLLPNKWQGPPPPRNPLLDERLPT